MFLILIPESIQLRVKVNELLYKNIISVIKYYVFQYSQFHRIFIHGNIKNALIQYKKLNVCDKKYKKDISLILQFCNINGL